MADSKNITVTNYRLKQALADAEAEEMERHAKKMGEELKSSLSLKLGKVLKIYPSQDKAKVQLLDNKKKETVLIAHDFISGGMNINAYPMGTNTTENGKNAIIPSDDLYCVVMHTSDEKHKVLLSYVDLDEAFNRTSIRSGEYRMQVGENFISLTDKYINMKAQNFFINGLPYTEAYTPLTDYYDKSEITEQNNNYTEELEKLKNKITELEKTYTEEINPSQITSASTWRNNDNGFFIITRTNNIITFTGGFQLKAKYPSTGWKMIAEIPYGYKPNMVIEIGNTSPQTHFNNLRINNGLLEVYVSTANTEYTEPLMANGTWLTLQDTPIQKQEEDEEVDTG